MAQRITKKRLEYLAAQASECLKTELTLSNVPHYGGWAIEINNGSRRLTQRKSAEACEAFLEGVILASEAAQ